MVGKITSITWKTIRLLIQKRWFQSIQSQNSVMAPTSSYEAVIIGPDMTATMSVPLPGDNKTQQSTIWQLYAAEVSAKSRRLMLWKRDRDTAAAAQCGLAPVCEILLVLYNLLICPLTHTISYWPQHNVARRVAGGKRL